MNVMLDCCSLILDGACGSNGIRTFFWVAGYYIKRSPLIIFLSLCGLKHLS